MLQEIEVLQNIVRQNPKDSSLEKAIKKLKFDVFTRLIENPNSNETLQIGRNFCELEVIYALGRQEIDEYELAAQRLKNIYNDTLKPLGLSQNYYQFQGVYLLYLLSFNKIGLFYSEMELLPRAGLDHPSISFVIKIEEALSIGNYSTILQCQNNAPTGLESVFLGRIINTIRDQTAISASFSYQQIRIADALELFHMSNVQDLQKYAKTNNYNWKFDNSYIYLDQVQLKLAQLIEQVKGQCFKCRATYFQLAQICS